MSGDGIDFRRARWFSQLPREVKEDVIRASLRMKLRTGAPIFRQGDKATGLFGLLAGEAQVTGMSRDGAEILISVVRPGEWVGFLACLDEGAFAFSVIASSPCDVLHLPLAAVRRIFKSDAARFQLLVAPEIAATRAVYRDMIERNASTPLQRLARQLVSLSSAPHGGAARRQTISPITQDQLAVSVTASRQWTNRTLQMLEREGYIAVSRSRIDILDLPRLQQLAELGEEAGSLEARRRNVA